MGRLRNEILLVLAVALLVSPAASFAATPAGDATVVGTDPAGDWGDQPALAPVGDALGQDLIEASIAKPDPQSLRFTMTFTNLPDSDPTVTGAYLWSFGTPRGERTLINCGTIGVRDCEKAENFVVLGECEYQEHPVLGDKLDELGCEELGEVAAELDRDSNSVSVTVPLSTIMARPGHLLTMEERWIVAASPAFFTAAYADSMGNNWSTYLNFDVLEVERNYRIPR